MRYISPFLFLFLVFTVTAGKKSILAPVPGKVNKPFYHESAPSVTADGKTMFYLSQNPNRDGAKEREDWDINITRLEGETWLGGRPIRSLNSQFYEGYPSISADGRTIFFSTNAFSKLADRDKDIYFSTYNSGKWSQPENMGRNINIEGLDEIGGSISPNGQIFVFFAESRDDSVGKADIYISYRQEDGSWGKAKNMGRRINSKYREFAPYIAADSRTLYFSSDRRGGRGGFDLYKSTLRGRKWSKPKNLGSKVNTDRHDIGISIPAEGDRFFTSQIGKDGWDILTGVLPPRARPFKVILVKGAVTSKTTGKPVVSDVLIEDLDTGRRIGKYLSSSDDGTFVVSLMEGTRYAFTVQSNGYFLSNETYNFKKIGKYREENLDIKMVPIVTGQKAVIKNIFFASGSARLDKKSRYALNRVVEILKANSKLKLEIQGHTDSIGSKANSQKLSEKRADSVVKYLVKKGISKDRLQAKGFGETQPIASNDTAANRAKNRRIEFFVLEN